MERLKPIHSTYLQLVQLGIGTWADNDSRLSVPDSDSDEWEKLRTLADKQGLTAVVMDGLISAHDNGLIDMRADGEITKEVFNEKSASINADIDNLQNEITALLPPPKTEEDDDPLYEDKLTVLKHFIENKVDFENIDRISDSIIRAFVRKIVVRENRIDWYLRFNDPNSYTSVNVKGRKDNAVVVETDESTPTLGNSPTGCYR